MKIQDIKTPGFITEPRLMGEQEDGGIGQIHYSNDTLIEVAQDGYYMSANGDLYHYEKSNDSWYKYDKSSNTYTSSSAPFRN